MSLRRHFLSPALSVCGSPESLHLPIFFFVLRFGLPCHFQGLRPLPVFPASWLIPFSAWHISLSSFKDVGLSSCLRIIPPDTLLALSHRNPKVRCLSQLTRFFFVASRPSVQKRLFSPIWHPFFPLFFFRPIFFLPAGPRGFCSFSRVLRRSLRRSFSSSSKPSPWFVCFA